MCQLILYLRQNLECPICLGVQCNKEKLQDHVRHREGMASRVFLFFTPRDSSLVRNWFVCSDPRTPVVTLVHILIPESYRCPVALLLLRTYVFPLGLPFQRRECLFCYPLPGFPVRLYSLLGFLNHLSHREKSGWKASQTNFTTGVRGSLRVSRAKMPN